MTTNIRTPNPIDLTEQRVNIGDTREFVEKINATQQKLEQWTAQDWQNFVQDVQDVAAYMLALKQQTENSVSSVTNAVNNVTEYTDQKMGEAVTEAAEYTDQKTAGTTLITECIDQLLLSELTLNLRGDEVSATEGDLLYVSIYGYFSGVTLGLTPNSPLLPGARFFPTDGYLSAIFHLMRLDGTRVKNERGEEITLSFFWEHGFEVITGGKVGDALDETGLPAEPTLIRIIPLNI